MQRQKEDRQKGYGSLAMIVSPLFMLHSKHLKIVVIKKYILLLFTVTLSLSKGIAQNVGTGITTLNASAMLDVTGTSLGLLVPRMSSLQRTNIATTAQGLLVYDTDTNTFWFYNSSSWTNLSVSAAGGWLLTGNSATNPFTHFLGTIDNQPLR